MSPKLKSRLDKNPEQKPKRIKISKDASSVPCRIQEVFGFSLA